MFYRKCFVGIGMGGGICVEAIVLEKDECWGCKKFKKQFYRSKKEFILGILKYVYQIHFSQILKMAASNWV